MRNGNAHTQSSRSGSSAALFVNPSSNHTYAWTTDDGDRGHCGTPHKELTDPAVQKILDLLKEQRAHSLQNTKNNENDDESDQAIVEWQMVAMVADRVMLVVFTLVVLVVCTALFGGAPT